MALYRRGNFEGALAKYREVLEKKPKSPDAYAGIIRVYLKQKKVAEAASTANEALRQHASAWLMRKYCSGKARLERLNESGWK